ncbi:MAG TPA: DUF488 family protein [Minicystis sp.]|nr:DUF488 family protein [Minicystis sp.]
MPIKTRRWNDPREPGDGLRVLVCRYHPRGVKKEDETWDAWWKNLGPSVELHAAFWGKHGEPIRWTEFKRRYLAEVKAQRAAIEELGRRVAAGETVTLLCSSACDDPARGHRSLLAALVERAAANVDAGRARRRGRV